MVCRDCSRALSKRGALLRSVYHQICWDYVAWEGISPSQAVLGIELDLPQKALDTIVKKLETMGYIVTIDQMNDTRAMPRGIAHHKEFIAICPGNCEYENG